MLVFKYYRVNAVIRDLALNNQDQVKKAHLVLLHLPASIVVARRVEEYKSWDHHHLPLAHRSVVHQTVRQWTWTLQVTFMACIRLLVFKRLLDSEFLYPDPEAIHTTVKLCLWNNKLEGSLTSTCNKSHTLIVPKGTNGQIFDCDESDKIAGITSETLSWEKNNSLMDE